MKFKVMYVEEDGTEVQSGTPEVGLRVVLRNPPGDPRECLVVEVSSKSWTVEYNNGHRVEVSKKDFTSWSYAKAAPVEVAADRERANIMAGIANLAGPVTPELPDPMEEEEKEVPTGPRPRPTLDVALERYSNLDAGIKTFAARLNTWVVSEGQAGLFEAVDALEDAWSGLWKSLCGLKECNATVKVTNRSRSDGWMRRPGVPCSLRDDVLKRFGAVYSADVLENLTIRVALDNDVFLMSGDRELGMVPKSHVVKRGAK